MNAYVDLSAGHLLSALFSVLIKHVCVDLSRRTVLVLRRGSRRRRRGGARRRQNVPASAGRPEEKPVHPLRPPRCVVIATVFTLYCTVPTGAPGIQTNHLLAMPIFTFSAVLYAAFSASYCRGEESMEGPAEPLSGGQPRLVPSQLAGELRGSCKTFVRRGCRAVAVCNVSAMSPPWYFSIVCHLRRIPI
jgi:hypothetical protein